MSPVLVPFVIRAPTVVPLPADTSSFAVVGLATFKPTFPLAPRIVRVVVLLLFMVKLLLVSCWRMSGHEAPAVRRIDVAAAATMSSGAFGVPEVPIRRFPWK